MIKLEQNFLDFRTDWERVGIEIPRFDFEKMLIKTKEQPAWIHFGAGNIFRGFIAVLAQTLLDKGVTGTGVIAVEAYDTQIITKMYKPYANLCLLAIMNADGTLDKKVIGSIAEGLIGDASCATDWTRLQQIFRQKSLQMASFTITEKGYSLTNLSGEYLEDLAHDFIAGPEKPSNIMAKITGLAYARYKAGKLPIAFVSMDNCSHNGEKLEAAMLRIAGEWQKKGFVEIDFLDYLNDRSLISFPWTMIDKITPRPSEKIGNILEKSGFKDTEIVCTAKKTFIAPFVNAEVSEILVIEDVFPNGRMALEAAGVLFTNRQTVENVEKMKVGTCLNPLHTALAIFGCLLGYTLIADEMKDPLLKALIEKIGYEEGMPVVIHPGIINPKDFIREVIEVRLPNPYIPDTPQRIATDTSQKMPVRFGETILSYVKRTDLNVKDLKYIPLVIAGWCRYLLGIDDHGEKMELSSDPLLPELEKYVQGVRLGEPGSAVDCLKPILANKNFFATNLYEIGLGEKIENYFLEMLSGTGAVRKTLNKYLSGI